MLLNPKIDKFEHLDKNSREAIKKLIHYFENKGLKAIKKDDHEREWYSDFLEFIKKEEIFSQFLTPALFGTGNTRWDTYRICQLNEVLGFYGLCYWYTWQVTILGLGPIWMSDNKNIQYKTAKFLKDGGIFAYGLSEKEHGADIYSTSMTLTPKGDGTYVANGEKYYIGNANQASFISTFGKLSDSGDFVFFVVDSQHEKFECIQNVTNSQNYVAEFRLNDYPITDKDILAKGREAWDMSLNTVNIGKFNLGWASIGICTHAFYEALDHASNRFLFNHYVTEFTHIKQLFVDAYTRLTAMKLFALRASDYMRAASPDDRRYLLYNPMVKMKVTTQGEEVINLLWDVIAAKGFEKSMYFEMAARDIRALPKLEGTVHVNMALIIKFMKNYFFNPADFSEIHKMDNIGNDDFLFNQGPTKGLGKIQFHDYKKVYHSVDLPNVKLFKKQIRLLKLFLAIAKPNVNQINDFDFLLNLGELFTLVVYGQLILENAKILDIEDDLVDQIFDFIIRDFSKFSLILYSKTSSTFIQKSICKKMIRKPVVDPDRFHRILKESVYSSKETYKMNP